MQALTVCFGHYKKEDSMTKLRDLTTFKSCQILAYSALARVPRV